MAQITTTTDPGLDLTVRKVIGLLTVDDVLNTLAQTYSSTITRRIIWDLTAADLGTLTSDDLSRIAAAAAQYAPRVPEVKTAIIVPNAFTYGLTRMYDVYRGREGAKAPMKSFHKYSEALTWLSSDGKADEED